MIEPAEERPDWTWTEVLLIPIFPMGFQVMLSPMGLLPGMDPHTFIFSALLLSGVATVALAWYILCVNRHRTTRSLGWRMPEPGWRLATFVIRGVVLTYGVMVLGAILNKIIFKDVAPQQIVQEFHGVSDVSIRILAVAAGAVVAPIAEEIAYRGVLLRALHYRLGMIPALLISSFAFGAAHLDLHHFIPLALIGLVLGYLVLASRSIFPSIILHAIINTVGIIYSWKQGG